MTRGDARPGIVNLIMRGEYDGLAVRLEDQEGDSLSGGFDAFLKRKAFKPPTEGFRGQHTHIACTFLGPGFWRLKIRPRFCSGDEVAYQCVDVTQPEDLRALVGLATELFGRLDVLASVAGVAVNAPLQSGELGDWNTMIDVNLRGVLHGIAAALPVFRAQGSGHFITVGSTADPAGLFRGHAARLSSRRARWVVLRRSRGVPFQYASSRSRLRAQAMYTWSRRVFGSPR